MSKPDGGPAFPGKICVGHTAPEETPIYTHPAGMTLRDYFAAQALNGILAFPGAVDGSRDKVALTVARAAYDYADAMIALRSAGK